MRRHLRRNKNHFLNLKNLRNPACDLEMAYVNRIECPAIQGYPLLGAHLYKASSTVSVRLRSALNSFSFAATALVSSRTPSPVAEEIAKNGFSSSSAFCFNDSNLSASSSASIFVATTNCGQIGRAH